MRILTIFIVMVFFFTPLLVEAARNKSYCGDLKSSFGPFDYMDRFNLKKELDIVEAYHFTSNVENMISGQSTVIGGDLNYTLHAWPNHHRALVTLFKYSIKEKSTRIAGLKWPVECYFDRAIRMNTKDAQVRSIYSAFLSHHNRNKEALKQLRVAANLEPNNATILYNLGLLYFKQKNYEKAGHYAEQAYALDFPLPGLRNKLIRAGKWRGSTAKDSGK
ncbi:TPR repeat-containing protein [Nitrosomonas eutropha]|uniref:TPR repeat-containing protein n=1 Tax=Nitrosomonas eutropha TaxID=916 RepID=A0A1I7IQC9_9PROT|nr:tetratricopeptide repeat protein [Nitrosomonas eutropha]SFU75104.1 TPR repeat-containing protein [Nitrosomonas eutropha]